MPQVSITGDALRELRERMSRYAGPMGILIMGPMDRDSRAPVDLEEAWALEKIYGPAQRWVLDILPLKSLTDAPVEESASLFSDNVAGIHVKVVASQPVDKLRVELHGENIRVFEDDI